MGVGEATLARLKRFAGLGPDGERPYVCRNCDGEFEVQYHVCPDCESYTVERRRG